MVPSCGMDRVGNGITATEIDQAWGTGVQVLQFAN